MKVDNFTQWLICVSVPKLLTFHSFNNSNKILVTHLFEVPPNLGDSQKIMRYASAKEKVVLSVIHK